MELEGRAREVEMRMMEMESGEKRGRDRRVEELEEQVVSLEDQVKRAEEGLAAERGARREAESAAEGVAGEVNYLTTLPGRICYFVKSANLERERERERERL
jgi:hypothetical protein